MTGKKSWVSKRDSVANLPKTTVLDKQMMGLPAGSSMVIPAPCEVDELMKRVPRGRVTTTTEIRIRLALHHHTDAACPLTTGIFSWISSHAAEEERASGKKRITPYWRTLKPGGEINPKYPGGIETQIRLLEEEGHEIYRKGKRFFVKDYLDRLFIMK